LQKQQHDLEMEKLFTVEKNEITKQTLITTEKAIGYLQGELLRNINFLTINVTVDYKGADEAITEEFKRFSKIEDQLLAFLSQEQSSDIKDEYLELMDIIKGKHVSFGIWLSQNEKAEKLTVRLLQFPKAPDFRLTIIG
jgi:hypothetical protein